MNRAAAAVLVAALSVPHLPDVTAQSYPDRPVHIIVPFTPGSASDILARAVGEKLSSTLGQPVVVENRPGAGGTIGTAAVARAEPDGYTLVTVSAGHIVNPLIYGKLPYDPLRDFAAVIPLGNLPSVLAVAPSLGVHTVSELVALAKSKPGTLNYASGGIGSASHVNAEKFRAASGIDAVHVPLKGAPEMVSETLAGRTHFGFFPIIATLAAIREGRLVALAVSSARRSAALPDVPTAAEAGVPGAQFDFWIGLLAPAKTPRPIIRKLNADMGAILQSAEMVERLARLGAEPMPMTPEAFDAYMREQLATLGPIMKAAGLSAPSR
jgi:tripartite-type tricarboxylate transporter receptor subunit TctC